MSSNTPEEPVSSSQGMTVDEMLKRLHSIKRRAAVNEAVAESRREPSLAAAHAQDFAALEKAIAIVEKAPSLEAEAATLREQVHKLAAVVSDPHGFELAAAYLADWRALKDRITALEERAQQRDALFSILGVVATEMYAFSEHPERQKLALEMIDRWRVLIEQATAHTPTEKGE